MTKKLLWCILLIVNGITSHIAIAEEQQINVNREKDFR